MKPFVASDVRPAAVRRTYAPGIEANMKALLISLLLIGAAAAPARSEPPPGPEQPASMAPISPLRGSAGPITSDKTNAPPNPVAVRADNTSPEAHSARLDNYTLGPEDEVLVTVYNEPDLKLDQKIGAQGEIDMPLVGLVRASGMTPTALARAIEGRLKPHYLRDPHVSVTVMTYRPFYVVGEVARPGAYPFTPDLTVASAIATAGGFAHSAARGSIRLRRHGSANEVRLSHADNTPLEPGDTVSVGRSVLSNLGDVPLWVIGVLRY